LDYVSLKGGYPNIDFPCVHGLLIQCHNNGYWVANHRNPRRYETIIQLPDPNAYTQTVNADNLLNPWTLDGFTILHNGIYGAGGVGASESNGIIINNIIKGRKTSGNSGNAINGSGHQSTGQNDPSYTLVIKNNVLTNSGNGIRTPYNTDIVNNTIINNTEEAVWVSGSGVTLTNNIIVQNQKGIYTPNDAVVTGGYNCVWNNTNGDFNFDALPHTINADPLLTANGDGKSDGYYLAQIPGDLTDNSFHPLQGTDVSSMEISTNVAVGLQGNLLIECYANSANDDLGTKLYSRTKTDSGYDPGNTESGPVGSTPILLRIKNQNKSILGSFIA